jgi:hypothetical protein
MSGGNVTSLARARERLTASPSPTRGEGRGEGQQRRSMFDLIIRSNHIVTPDARGITNSV